MRFLMTILLIISTIWFIRCASGENNTGDSNPTILSTEDTGGNDIVEASKIEGQEIVITFSAAMDPDTINTETLAITNDEGSAVSGTVASATDTDDIEANTFSWTAASELASMGAYTFTVFGGGEGVKDASGNAMADNASFDFTAACTFSDDFSNPATLVPTSGCWEYNEEDNLDAFLSIDDGALQFSFGAEDNTNEDPWDIFKVDTGNHTYALRVLSADQVDAPFQQHRVGMGLSVYSSEDIEGEPEDTINLSVQNNNSIETPGLELSTHQEVGGSDTDASITADDFPIGLRIVRNGTSVSTEYMKEGAGEADWTVLFETETFPEDENVEIDLRWLKDDTGEPFTGALDDFTRD